MPKFTVLRRVDAWVDYVAVVKAKNAEAAAEIAQDREAALDWEHRGTVEFDARGYVALDAEGDEIEDSRCGDW